MHFITYSERLFLYKKIGFLTDEQSRNAIANVAKNLNKSVSSISTTRAQLINKGIIYPIRYRELDFTVPEFSGYIQRLEEYRLWCEEKEL